MSLFSFASSRGPRWQLALQAALGISVPIAAMTIAGRPVLGLIAASGAFTALHLGALPVIERARMLPIVAAALIVSGAFGVLASSNIVVTSVGLVLVSVIAAALAYCFRLGPPGPLFFVLVFGLSASIVGSGSVPGLVYLGALTAGCLFSYALAVAPLVFARARQVPSRRAREILPGPSWTADEQMLLLRVALVAVVGVAIGLLVDPAKIYWIVGSAVAVIGVAAGRRAAFHRGMHRMLGTIIGAGLYALLAVTHPSGLLLAALLGLLQFVIELVVVRNYALSLVFITPLVLLLVGAATGTIGSMDIALERVVDTLIGATLGALSGLVHPRATSATV